MARTRDTVQVDIDATLIKFIDSWRPGGCSRTALINAMLHEASIHNRNKYKALEEAGLES